MVRVYSFYAEIGTGTVVVLTVLFFVCFARKWAIVGKVSKLQSLIDL
jgi:hypothetical protein